MDDLRNTEAAERTLWAAERTLMAWIRTALSMISFGFAMDKFIQYLHASRDATGELPLFAHLFGVALVALGTFVLVTGALQYRRDRIELLPHLPASMKRRKLAPLVAWILAGLGAVVLLVLLLTYGGAAIESS